MPADITGPLMTASRHTHRQRGRQVHRPLERDRGRKTGTQTAREASSYRYQQTDGDVKRQSETEMTETETSSYRVIQR